MKMGSESCRRRLVELIVISCVLWHCGGELLEEYDGESKEIRAVSGEDESSNLQWPLDQLRILLGMNAENRGQLGDQILAAAPSPMDDQTPAPSPSGKETGMQGDNMPFFPFGPSITTPTPPGQSSSAATPVSTSNSPSPVRKKNGNYRAVVISVVVTASATCVMAGLLLYLYQKFCRSDNHVLEEHKPDRPLLTSRHSDGSDGFKGIQAPDTVNKLAFNAGPEVLYLGTIEQFSESDMTHKLPYTELDITNATKLPPFHRDQFERFPLSPFVSKGVESPEVDTRPLFRGQPFLPGLESSSDDESFYSPCETPCESPCRPVSRRSFSPAQHPSRESPLSPALSSSSLPSSPSKPSPFPSTSPPVIPLSCTISSKQLDPSRSPPPPPPPPLTPSSRCASSPPPQSCKGKPTSQQALPSCAFARDSGPSLPPLPPRPPPSFLSSSKAGLGKSVELSSTIGTDGTLLPKLKPLYWDKVRATPDRSMVWDKLRSGSFELDEEMIESLFSYNSTNPVVKSETIRGSFFRTAGQDKHILDSKKSQNIAILLRALSVTQEEVCDALLKGTGDGLSTDLLETLVKMSPTKEEEAKLKNYNGDISKLGPAEQFIKALLDIPYAFRRFDAMLYRATFEEEVVFIKKSLETLEVACKELRCSCLFLKLLEAVLKTGNRMNVGTFRGEAQAFKLDALLKLADIKGIDGKTTLLHFVVQEIIRAEGIRTAEMVNSIDSKLYLTGNDNNEEGYRKLGLQLISGLSTELYNVKRAAGIDSDALISSLSKLIEGLVKLIHSQQTEFGRQAEDEKITGSSTCDNFNQSMTSFLHEAEQKINQLQKEEDRVFSLVKEITEYFHGDSGKEEAQPLRIFVIVRDFLGMLDQVCNEVDRMKQNTVSGVHKGPTAISVLNLSHSLFPTAFERKIYSSDDESTST